MGERRRSLIVPREHGAWGILLVPMLTGAWVGLGAGGGGGGLAPFAVAALSLFWLRTPVESWMGTTPIRARTEDELGLVRRTTMGLSLVSVGALAWLFWGGRNTSLWWIGAAAGLAFAGQAAVKRVWRGARAGSQMIGAAGLTATAPAAYVVVTGRLDATAWWLWAANVLFAMNQIQFVQLRIHAARAADRREKVSAGRWFLAGQVVLMGLVVAACVVHEFRWYAALAFVPVLLRGFAWFWAAPRPLAVQALGKSELAYAALFAVMLAVGMGVASAQVPVSFEVASVKVHKGEVTMSIDPSVRGQTVWATASTLIDLITYAYGVRYEQLVGGPEWARSEHYDLEAKVAGDAPPTVTQARQMVESLLAERFQLKVHRETREEAVYALVVGKGGPKMKASTPDAPGRGFTRGTEKGLHMEATKGTMEQLARQLSNTAGRPVVDRTGLTGLFAFTLDWFPANRERPPDMDAPSMFEAVQQQLGLKLEATKAAQEKLVIDRAERLSEN